MRGDEAAIPIGRPIVNTSLYVLDEQLRNVPIGDKGELFIGGQWCGEGIPRKAGTDQRNAFLRTRFRDILQSGSIGPATSPGTGPTVTSSSLAESTTR